jgi:hypothetical protein
LRHFIGKKKVKFVPVHAMKAYRGNRGMATLNLGCRRRLVAPAALSPEKNLYKH